MRRSHTVSLLAVSAVAIASLVGVLAAGWAPVLGVQLQGGVEVVLRPTEEATDEQLDRAIEIIRARVDSLGVAEPDITRQGQQVVIQLPGVNDTARAVDVVGQTAELRFRPVQLSGDANDPEQRASFADLIDVLAAPVPPGGNEDDAAEAGGDGGDADDTEIASPSSTTAVAPTTSDAITPVTSSTTAPGASTTSTSEVAPTSAPATSAPTTTEGSAEVPPTTAPPTTAPPTTEPFDPATAPDLDEIVTSRDDDLAESTVLLPGTVDDEGNQAMYILAPAELTGEIVADAAATFQGAWVVNVSFTGEGSDAWDAMAATNFGQQMAIVLDGVVESAPVIQAQEFGGQAVISGNFDQQRAENLALVLRFGALPIEFEQDDVRTVSPTLGEGTLRAGVVAGLVGLVGVSFYMILYYRLLGLVAMSSLAISGSLLWAIIAWLGESRGLALTLAGATGIIVSVGVQVDSNIVYYERIKEEVQRGRAVRSAVDGSFSAAFRTIVWADLASLIGAAVLYSLTTGSVKGFALFLGLTVFIDIFVSYLFMHPLVVFIARRMINEVPERIGIPASTGEVAS